MEQVGVNLRPIERDDLSFLRDLANDPVVRANVVGWDWPLSLAGQEVWFNSSIDSVSTRRYIIEDTNTGQSVGMTGLWQIDWHNRSAETAIKLGGKADVRRKGYGYAALKMMMNFAFLDVGLNRLHTTIRENNEPSRALFVDRCGWTVEGLLRSHIWRDGQYEDLLQLGILESEYSRWAKDAKRK